MQKFIVEISEPKPGEKISSGGLRKEGKLKSLFKNPVPYKEPTVSTTEIRSLRNMNQNTKEQLKSIGQELLAYALKEAGKVVVEELALPLIRKGVHKVEERVIKEDEQKKSMAEVDSDDNCTIPFPNRKAV